MVVHRDLPRTLLPLDRWAQLIGLDPRHFRQVTTSVHPATVCSKVWKQYSWQEADQVGRFDVADAIQQAERVFAQYLGYKLLPTWEFEERQQTPKPATPELYYRTTFDPTGYRLAVQADWAHYVEGGIESKSLIEAGVAITYSDEDSDSYDETATISFATTVTDEEELAIFYPGEDGDDEWEIRPLISVSISAGVATITMWRHQLVLPNLIEALDPAAVDGGVDGNFLTTVDVYRRFNDPSTQATLIWGPNLLCGACSTNSGCCTVCGQTTQTGCLMPKDYRSSWLMYRAATFDSDDEEFDSATLTCGRNPDQLLLHYRAGFQDKTLEWPTLQMDRQWERAVAYYALALLDREICECAPVKGISDKWREDLARQSPAGGTFQITDNIMDNPLGTSRAAQYAWNMIKERGRRVASPVKY